MEYKNNNELRKKEVLGKHYNIRFSIFSKKDVLSFLIFKPHGGGIEPETSEICNELGKYFPYYCFEGKGNSNCMAQSLKYQSKAYYGSNEIFSSPCL